MAHINTRINRLPAAQLAALAQFSAATLHEAQSRSGALPARIKPVDSRMRVCGPALTVRCAPGDNLMLQVAIAYAQAGDVVVMACDGYAEIGAFGDVLASACLAKGVAGVVLDSGARDAGALRALGLPVFSSGLCIKGAIKSSLGTVNHPVSIGGQIVHPGDIVCGDEDGVVVVPAHTVQQVAAAAAAREEMERGKIARYQAGRSVIEVNGLAGLLEERGLSVD